jgi:hypothetical protein
LALRAFFRLLVFVFARDFTRGLARLRRAAGLPAFFRLAAVFFVFADRFAMVRPSEFSRAAMVEHRCRHLHAPGPKNRVPLGGILRY